MQVSKQIKTTKQWASDEKNLAMTISYESPSTYTFLRNSKNIHLPVESSIRRWIGNSKLKPGLIQMFLNNLKLKLIQ